MFETQLKHVKAWKHGHAAWCSVNLNDLALCRQMRDDGATGLVTIDVSSWPSLPRCSIIHTYTCNHTSIQCYSNHLFTLANAVQMSTLSQIEKLNSQAFCLDDLTTFNLRERERWDSAALLVIASLFCHITTQQRSSKGLTPMEMGSWKPPN